MGLVKPSQPGYFADGHRRILERWTSAPHSGNRRTSAVTGSRSSLDSTRTSPNLRTAGYVIAVAGTALVTIAFLPIRDNITPLSKGFAYLAVVVAAAATGSLGPGIAASVLGFLSFNYFFLPPYGQWTIARPEYVAVLFAFLALSVIISELLARAAERARSAEAREAELRTIQELSRELTTRVPGEDTIEVALLTVKNAFGYEAAALFVEQTEDVRGLVQQVTVGGPPGSVSATWDPRSPEQPPERLPLSVGGRMLGLVVLKGDRPPLTPAESRVLRAFCDQLALVLERDRLLRSATEAEVYRQTESVRRSLLAAVSHDLRSPLAAIKASVTDLLDDVPGTTAVDRREALEAIDARDRPSERVDRQSARHVEDPGGLAPRATADGGPGRDRRGIGRPVATAARAHRRQRADRAGGGVGAGRSRLPGSDHEQPPGERGHGRRR